MTTATHTDLKLYRAHSVIDGWPHRSGLYNGVRVDWFVHHRDQPVVDRRHLLAEVIERQTGFGDGSTYIVGRDRVDELFTRGEATQLAAYLKRAHGVEVIVEEESLPVEVRDGEAELCGVGGHSVGGDNDFYMLSEHDDYTLPFKAWGYFDLYDQYPVKVRACSHECKHHERVDEYIDYVQPTTWAEPGTSDSSPF